MSISQLLDVLEARVQAAAAGDPGAVLDDQALDEAAELLRQAVAENDGGVPWPVGFALAWLHWLRYEALPEDEDEDDLRLALFWFEAVHASDPQAPIPDEIRRHLAGDRSGGDGHHEAARTALKIFKRAMLADDPAALDQAVDLLTAAIDAAPPDHPGRPGYLSNLGVVLRTRFDRTGDIADMDTAVTVGQQALDATPPGHPDHAMYLANLSVAQQTRYGRTGNAADLDAAIATGRQAVDASPPDHADLAGYLSNLGSALRTRFERTGDTADLDAAVAAGQQAVDITPADHSHRSMYLSNIGTALLARFSRTRDTADLDAAVAAGRQAVDATPPGHPDRPGYLSNLAIALRTRFDHTGDVTDLDDAVAAGRQAVAGTPRDHPDLAIYLSNLGFALRTRFGRTGALTDLDDAVTAGQRAVDATPPGHPDRAGRLSNLCGALQTRFKRTSDVADIDAAVSAGQRAVDATPPDHPELAGCLSNLGTALQNRFEYTGDVADLNAAVAVGRRAADLDPSDRSHLAATLSNLGIALRTRFEHTRDITDLDTAVDVGRRAVAANPPEPPQRAMHLFNLGTALRTRFEHAGTTGDLREAAGAWSQAAVSAGAPISVRLHAARACAQATVELDGPVAALGVYSGAFELLPLLAWRGISDGDRRHLLDGGAASLARDAAGCAIAAGDLPQAVEFLEQGRGVLWAQLLDGRTDLTDLEHAHPDLARQLHDCRAVLDQPTTGQRPDAAADDARRDAARRFDALVAEVRSLPPIDGFPHPDRFLRPPQTDTLLPGEDDGPVVVVNISRWRCDALILRHTGITHVPLPGLTEDDTIDAANRYLHALQGAAHHAGSKDIVALTPAGPPPETVVSATLAWLWDHIASAVLDHLGHTGTPDGDWPRVWWCPTGALTILPLHAAGHHAARTGHTVYDRVVSSYTPTLRALAHARNRPATAATAPTLLVVALPHTPGQSPLPGADAERSTLAGLFGQAYTELVDGAATRATVIAGLRHHRWLHASCHGTQNMNDPAAGGLIPHDWQTAGLVGIGDLTDSTQAGGEFAFLSACKTATGGGINLDESINIATAMQYAGWRHVIGTLWSVWDHAAATVTAGVYPALVHDGALDPTHAAHALHHTVRRLRDKHPDRPGNWAPFIHTGP